MHLGAADMVVAGIHVECIPLGGGTGKVDIRDACAGGGGLTHRFQAGGQTQRLQIFAVSECKVTNIRYTLRDGDRGQLVTHIEHIRAEAGDALAQSHAGQTPHLAAGGVADLLQTAGQRQCFDAVAVGKGVGFNGGHGGGNRQLGQGKAVDKSAGADALQPAGQRYLLQLRALGEGIVAQLRDALLHHHGAHTVVQAIGTPRCGIPLAYEIVVVHRAGAADGQRTAGIQRPPGVVTALAAAGVCGSGTCGIVGEGILVAADAGGVVVGHGADLIDIGFARLVLEGRERGLAAAYPVVSVVLPTVFEFLGAKDLIAVRALDGGPVQGKLPVAVYAAGELGGRQHGGGGIVHLGPLQRVVIGADGHGPPTGLTAAEMHGGQRLTAAEGALGDLLNAIGQGHGGQGRAAVEHMPGDLIQPAGQRDLGKGGASQKCGAAQTLQGVGQGDRLQGAAPIKQVAAGVADAVGNGDAGQLFAAAEHTIPQFLQARRQRDGGQVVQKGEGAGADKCNALAHNGPPDLLAQAEPRRVERVSFVGLPSVSVVVHRAGAGDGQRALIIQRPCYVLAAGAAGHRSGFRGVHQA